jgi:hypothetical protein
MKYGMYTEQGNNLVHNLVMTARRSGWDFDTVCRHLVLLSKAHPKDAGEATDTIVREVVYTALFETA